MLPLRAAFDSLRSAGSTKD